MPAVLPGKSSTPDIVGIVDRVSRKCGIASPNPHGGSSVLHATDAASPLPEESTVHYAVDSKASMFTAQAFATGILSAFGHSPTMAIRDFDGDAWFTLRNATIENVRMRIRIRASSLEVIDDISDKDRSEIQRQMYDEVLEVDRFSEIVYECSSVAASGSGDHYSVSLNGQLTLHGVTRPQPVSARVLINGDTLRASGEFSVRQSDHEIAPVKVAGGALRLKDEVKCAFNIKARKPA